MTIASVFAVTALFATNSPQIQDTFGYSVDPELLGAIEKEHDFGYTVDEEISSQAFNRYLEQPELLLRNKGASTEALFLCDKHKISYAASVLEEACRCLSIP